MAAEDIKRHFVQFLGEDVGVSFDNPDDPRDVILYRPDRLSDEFASLAFGALQGSRPALAARIDRLLVSFEEPWGRTQRGIDIRPISLASYSIDIFPAGLPASAA
ncbi:MAG TPA: hypothetical protein VGN97_02555 [Mesorhizobium sp.]|nr:hypothetical protein [Mesorhizobium sp.]